MFLKFQNICIYLGLFLMRFQTAVKAEVGNVKFRPFDPVTTSDSISLECIASKEIMTYGADIQFRTDSEWLEHDATDKDGNPFISMQITKDGNMTQAECHVKVHEGLYNTTTTVYFLEDDNDPVLVQEGKDVQMSCVTDTTDMNEDLKYVWHVNGKTIPNDIYEKFKIEDKHILILKKAETNDSALNITCTVVSKRSFEQFYNEDIARATADGSAHTFQKRLSVLYFEKRPEQNNSVYIVKINEFDGYELQWFVNNEKVDTITSNSTSVTVSSTVLPTLVVLYKGKILWNDTVHTDVHADNTKTSDLDPSPSHENDDDVIYPVIIGVAGSGLVVVVTIIIGVRCWRRHKQNNGVSKQEPDEDKKGEQSDNLLQNPNDNSAAAGEHSKNSEDDNDEYKDCVSQQS